MLEKADIQGNFHHAYFQVPKLAFQDNPSEF